MLQKRVVGTLAVGLISLGTARGVEAAPQGSLGELTRPQPKTNPSTTGLTGPLPLGETPATVDLRIAGTNTASFQCGPAILGATTSATVDAGSTGHTHAWVFGFLSPVQIPLASGLVLLAFDTTGSGELLIQPITAGPLATFSWDVPDDPSLLGRTFYTQAMHLLGQPGFALSNAQDLTVGIRPPVSAPFRADYGPPGPYVFRTGTAIPPLVPAVSGGRPDTWSVSPALPDGLALNAWTGVITGTPEEATPTGTYRVFAENGGGSTESYFTLEIVTTLQPPTMIAYAEPGPLGLELGNAVGAIAPTANGDPPLAWTVAPPLPAGITLDPHTGVLAGSALATTAGAELFTITARNAAGATSVPFTITVAPPSTPPSGLAYASPGPLTLNLPIAPLAPAIGGGAATSWGVAPPLPSGLTLGSDGVVRGTPVAPLGATPFTVTASNALGQTSAALTLEVVGVAPSQLVYSPDPFRAQVGTGPYRIVPANQGGLIGSYLLGAPLPPGLVLEPGTGIVSGIPTSVTPSSGYAVIGSNESGSTVGSLTIRIKPATPPGTLSYTPAGPVSFPVGAELAPLVPSVTGRADRFTVQPSLPNRLLPPALGDVLPRAGVLLPENPIPIDYRPPEQTFVHPWQCLNVWLPAGTPPPRGWPCLVSNPIAGYFGAPPVDALDPNDPVEALYHRALNAGIAVVFAGASGSGPFNGFFYPPGHPTGRWEDYDSIMPEKDVLHSLQWVKTQSAYPIDPARIFLHGASAGATSACYVSAGPDRRKSSGSAQVRASSRVAGILAFDVLFSFSAYADDEQNVANHWESVTAPGIEAKDFGDAEPSIVEANSVARVLLDPLAMGATTPFFLAYSCPIGSTDYTNEPDGFPALRNELGANLHDLWNGGKFLERLKYLNGPFHQLRSEFWVANGYESGLGCLAGSETGTFSGTTIDSTELYDAAVAWIVARCGEPIRDPSGLQLHPKSGIITGTPNVPAHPRDYSVTAFSPGGSTSEVLNLRVNVPKVDPD